MALYTGKGDGGTTKLFDSASGVRVSKSSPIFEALGMLDELNCTVGWCRVACSDGLLASDGRSFAEILREVQNNLFTIQAEVAGAEKSLTPEHALGLSGCIDTISVELPEIKTFLVPGGNETTARLDIARAVSRRVERRLVALHESGERAISEHSRAYANRLSSLFYALGRLANVRRGIEETPPHYSS